MLHGRRHALARLAGSGGWRKILRGYFTVVAGSAGARVLSFVAAIIIARSLGPAGFGDFSVFFALFVVFTAFGDFIDITYVRHVNAPGADRAMFLRGALVLRVTVCVLLLVLSYPLGVLLANSLFERPELAPAAAAAIAAGATLGLVSLRASAFLAQERMGLFSITTSLFYVGIVVVLCAVYASGLEMTTSLVYALFLATSALLGIVAAAMTLRATAGATGVGRSALRTLAKYAKWLFAASLVQTVSQRLDVILVTRYVSKEQVGLYGAALRYAMIAVLLIGALMGFLLPKIGRTRSSRQALHAYLREASVLVAMLVSVIAVLWLLAPMAIPRMFGQEFAEASSLARILLLGIAVTALSLPFGQLLLAEDAPRQILYGTVLRGVALGAVLIALVPSIGTEGAAWATVVAEVVGISYSAAVVFRRWPSRYRAMAAEHVVEPSTDVRK